MKRYLAVDPGDKRIGIALSDPTGTIAYPLEVLKHRSRLIDAATVAQIAVDYGVEHIVVGNPLESGGEVGPQARKATRFADAVREQTNIPVSMWDESESSQIASQRQKMLKMASKKRKSTLDSMAAVVILQTFLEYVRVQEKENCRDGEE